MGTSGSARLVWLLVNSKAAGNTIRTGSTLPLAQHKTAVHLSRSASQTLFVAMHARGSALASKGQHSTVRKPGTHGTQSTRSTHSAEAMVASGVLPVHLIRPRLSATRAISPAEAWAHTTWDVSEASEASASGASSTTCRPQPTMPAFPRAETEAP